MFVFFVVVVVFFRVNLYSDALADVMISSIDVYVLTPTFFWDTINRTHSYVYFKALFLNKIAAASAIKVSSRVKEWTSKLAESDKGYYYH